MSKVVLELSVSLDGFATGPEIGPDEPLGIGGERLHDWMFAGKSASDSEAVETAKFSEIGAVVLGRRMADLGIGPWGEEPTFHAPCFVVTHRPADTIVKKGGTSYIFVTPTGSRQRSSGHERPPGRRTSWSSAAQMWRSSS
jgi:dihydrofolate reductase